MERNLVRLNARHHKAAALIRKLSGTTQLHQVAKDVVAALAAHDIPSLICGGFAVQEHGHSRTTHDIDIIVPNPAKAQDWLQISGFKPARPGAAGKAIIMYHRETKTEINLLQGGAKVDGREVMELPMPTVVHATPVLVGLDTLISLKLSAWSAFPFERAQDLGDVTKLIKAHGLPRTFKVDALVKDVYERVWDGLAKDRA